MPFTNSANRYGVVTQALHWLVVLLVIVQFVLADIADDLPRGAEKLEWVARHRSVGLTIMVVALFRVAWRIFDRLPDPVPMPAWQRKAATLSHWGMYALLFALPLTGWMMSSAEGARVVWFGMLQLPGLVVPSQQLGEALHEIHEVLATSLLVLAGLHVLAALKHQLLDRDRLLSRMLPWGRPR